MKILNLMLFACILALQTNAQVTSLFDDFEGSGNFNNWVGDDCQVNINFSNPVANVDNNSSTVLRYQDTGGQYANVRFQASSSLDIANNAVFSLKIYVPSSSVSGNQPNQVSLKLQNGNNAQPWNNQTEIIQPIALDQWQEVFFDFENGSYINLDANSPAPTQRTDLNRVLIQVNGENNFNSVIAYIDDVTYGATAPPPTGSEFDVLVWADEFNIDGPVNAGNWHHQTILPNGGSWFNGEVQHYTNRVDNSVVENGVLKIIAKKETFTDQGYTKEYTSARLNSKFAFQYGRVEIRAKLPFGVGTWPALWTLGKNVTEVGTFWQEQGFGSATWPNCGEIDIMEHWGDNQNYVSSAIHTPSSFGGTVNNGGQTVLNASTQFHIYEMIWNEEEIIFKVDGNTHYTYNPAVKDANTWPFDAEQFFLFNVAMLPNVDSYFLQAEMEVDYIRVYQDANGINTNLGSSLSEANPQMSIESGDFHIEDSNFGTIYTSPNGSCYRVSVDDAGNLVTTLVSCP